MAKVETRASDAHRKFRPEIDAAHGGRTRGEKVRTVSVYYVGVMRAYTPAERGGVANQ